MKVKLFAAILFFVSVISRPTAAQVITTVAGNGTLGFNGDNIQATASGLHQPNGVVVDASGNLYIADVYNFRIRKVDMAGVITTAAGNGTAGFSGDNGPATAAELNDPHGIAIDAAGNLYIAEYLNHRIRKVSSLGIITTIAGTGTPGYSGDNGAATNAQLNYPDGIALDANGNLYVADVQNNAIRKISSAGIITTIAGNGTQGFGGDNGGATAAELHGPSGVAADGSGDIFIADTYNQRVRKVSAQGIITTVAGTGAFGNTGDNGLATAAELFTPSDIVIDGGGNLYIADMGNNSIRMINAAGTITTVAGNGTHGYSGDNGPTTAAELYAPQAIALDGSNNLYISDQFNYRIRKVTSPMGLAIVNSSIGLQATLAPNPAADHVTVTYSGGEHTTNVILMDATGRLAYRVCANGQSGSVIIPLQRLAPGYYTVIIQSGGQKVTGKLAKQ